ncbi:hypothetical protein MNBD_GAMMA18-497, partial [hydrothermal vent metagenome]
MVSKKTYIFTLVIILTLFSTPAWSVPEILFGAGVGGPEATAIPIHFEANDQGLTAIQIDLDIDLAEITPTLLTPTSNLKYDFEIISHSSIRIIIISTANDQEIPPGLLATLHFVQNGSGLSKSQILNISSVTALDATSTNIADISTTNGFIAFPGDELADSDNDGIPDVYEAVNGLHPMIAGDAILDTDRDGLPNVDEFRIGSNINNPDTDGDGIGDLFEHNFIGLSPLDETDIYQDFDRDGANNITEFLAGTYLDDSDSDNDGMDDGYELLYSVLDALDDNDADIDSDRDGLTNLEESILGSSPDRQDSDGDGLEDLLELNIGTNILVSEGSPIAADTLLFGQITSDSILLADTTYHVVANFDIAPWATLTIAPGAKLEFSRGVTFH